MAQGTLGAQHELSNAFFHQRTVGVGEGMQHVPSGARKGPVVAGLLLAFESTPGFSWSKSGVDRHNRLLFSEENPVAVFFGQVPPGTVYIVAKSRKDVALVLSRPSDRPGCNCALANRARVIRHHRAFGYLIDSTQPMATGAGAFWSVRGKRLRV